MTDELAPEPSSPRRSLDLIYYVSGPNSEWRCGNMHYSAVRVVRRPLGKSTRVSWDGFANQCQASFRCAYDALVVYQRNGKFMAPPLLFDLRSAHGGEKIGQCGVTKDSHNRYFIEALQILPTYEALWETALAAILKEIGSATYHYGSHWSIEPRREAALRRIPGVVIEDVTPVVVEAIDFVRWESWDHYLRQVSNNVRRNAARAARDRPHLQIRTRLRLATLLDFLKVVSLQRSMRNRKNIDASMTDFSIRLLLRTISLRSHAISATAIDQGRLLATYSGIDFGSNSYYLNGSSASDNGGAAWCLLLHMIKHAYTRTNGRGKFFMGSVRANDPGWAELHRSRLHCRVTEYATSLVSFSYHRNASEDD